MPDFHIVTLFPEFFTSPLATSLLGKAIAAKKLQVTFHNPRAFSGNRHGRVDDAPYGGGPGMVMRVEPVAQALRSIPAPGKILNLTPAGKPLNAGMARALAAEENITLICGRYEGIDGRLGEIFPDIQEVAFGEAILNGGETAALAVLESVARFIPGFMGKDESAEDESFVSGLLEYPQFTRPPCVEGVGVPEVLISGDHEKIALWRRARAVTRTFVQRPQLLNNAPLTGQDAETLRTQTLPERAKNLSFALFHYPVRLERGRVGCSSLTNLDIHDIARLAHTYGMGPFFVVSPLRDQLALLGQILGHWQKRPDTDRAEALSCVQAVEDMETLDAAATASYDGVAPLYIAASAQWPAAKKAPAPLTPAQLRAILAKRPVVICLGTARGLALERMPNIYAQLRPIRFLGANHLSVRSAAAILADRILGDYN